MAKRFPIRLRTFLVPLFGAALYLAMQFIVVSAFMLITRSTDIDRYTGSITFTVAAIMLPCVILWLFLSIKYEKKELLRQRISVPRSVSAAVIAIGMLGITSVYFSVLIYLSDYFPAIRDSITQYSKMVSDVEITLAGEKILYGIAVALLYPIIEEILFRGIIMQEFLSTMGRIPAIILSGLIFGLMHGQPVQIGYAFICGMIISAVYVYSQSIYLSILTHAVFNFFGTTVTGLIEGKEQVIIALQYIEYAFIFFAFAAMMYLRFTCKKNQIREDSSCGTS